MICGDRCCCRFRRCTGWLVALSVDWLGMLIWLTV
jgi:hypothetical protein